MNLLLPKVSLSNSFSDFKKLFSPNYANFLDLQMYFKVGTQHGYADAFLWKEGGI
jgi:hypothetical protein